MKTNRTHTDIAGKANAFVLPRTGSAGTIASRQNKSKTKSQAYAT